MVDAAELECCAVIEKLSVEGKFEKTALKTAEGCSNVPPKEAASSE